MGLFSFSRRSLTRRARNWRTSGPSNTSPKARPKARFEAREIAHFGRQFFERVEGRRVDVRDESFAQPAEGLLDITEIALRDMRRPAQQEATGTTAIA